jgi:hypothetical protein
MAFKTEGIVEKAYPNQSGKGYALYIAGTRYGSFSGVLNCKKGDLVSIEFSTSTKDGKTWNNIQKLDIIESAKETNPFKENSDQKTASMRESYAKDIFVSLINHATAMAVQDLNPLAMAELAGQCFKKIQEVINDKTETEDIDSSAEM